MFEDIIRNTIRLPSPVKEHVPDPKHPAAGYPLKSVISKS